MKNIFCVVLACSLILCLSACAKKTLTKDEIRTIIKDEVSQALDSKSSTFGTPEDDYTQYFNFALVNGKYCALSVKSGIDIPEVLVVPNKYKGVKVAYTGANLINALPVKTIIFESGVECSYCLCGDGNNCPTLEKIIFLSEDPSKCLKGKLRLAKDMPLQLNKKQINGECKIYVPDDKMEEYKKAWGPWAHDYAKLMCPLSELDEETAKYIK